MRIKFNNDSMGHNLKSAKDVIVKVKKVGDKIRLELDLNLWAETDFVEGKSTEWLVAPMMLCLQSYVKELAHDDTLYVVVDEVEEEYHE